MQWASLIVAVTIANLAESKPLHAINAIQKQTVNIEIDVVESCPSLVYCQGELLDAVQMMEIFDDSKTFVDMSQVNPVNVTLENFQKLLNDTNGNPTKDEIKQFVLDNFVSENETVSWLPPDYNSSPKFLDKITDPSLKEFAQNIIAIWPQLGRQVSDHVFEYPDQHSIIPVPNGFIVPGGRFREPYYWDSYWITKGLLVSEMYDTVRGMLENFIHLVQIYGFIPNGARVYYLNRSQPPLLTLMVAEYLNHNNDLKWLKDNIEHLEAELTFWLNNRTVVVEKDDIKYELAHYESISNTPRPESYLEDVHTCSYYKDEQKMRTCYKSLKTGAESGWDFSTRWLFDANGNTQTNLSHIGAQRVVPVDLNSFLCRAFRDLSNFYGKLNDTDKQIVWLERAQTWEKSIEIVLYDKNDGIWYDYDMVLSRPRKLFFPSNFVPLWAEVYDNDKKEDYGRLAAAYFRREGIIYFQGGIPTSLQRSGEQWDLTNAWPPLQEFVVLGLLNTGEVDAVEVAKMFAQRWVDSNMRGYQENQVMFEKYDAIFPGQYGGGGEYVVQAGFGWTNGVVLSFIDTFFTA